MSNDKQNSSERELLTRISKALDDSVDRLDAETCHKLNAARQRALAQQKRKTFFTSNWNKAILATAFTVFIAVLVVKPQWPLINEQGVIEEESFEAMELMAAQDALDLYEELEFYTWLADEDVTT